jgi:hypothetical protein
MTGAELGQVLGEVAVLLQQGAGDRRSAFHTPVVATSDADARIMVLRQFDAAAWLLRFHTDARSTKCAVIAAQPQIGLVFYDPAARVQIRARGQARIVSDGPKVDAAWDASSAFARRCYLAEAAPGAVVPVAVSGLPPEAEGVRPSEAMLVPARRNFALMLVELDRIDWLHLAHDGHRRAQLARSGADMDWLGLWGVPSRTRAGPSRRTPSGISGSASCS